MAVKFDLVDNAGEGTDSVGVFTGGAEPTIPAAARPAPASTSTAGTCSGSTLTYAAGVLPVAAAGHGHRAGAGRSYAVDIPAAVGGPTAYAGFTAGTGELFAPIDILDWKYASTDNWDLTTIRL